MFTLKASLEECIERDSKRKKCIGRQNVTEVYGLVSELDCGITIDTSNKTIEEVVQKITSYLPKAK